MKGIVHGSTIPQGTFSLCSIDGTRGSGRKKWWNLCITSLIWNWYVLEDTDFKEKLKIQD